VSANEPRQLPLELPHAPQYGAASFLVGPSNSAALSLITRWPDWPSPVVVLSGPRGSGKTHLAHIWAEKAGARLLDASELDTVPPEPSSLAAGLVLEDVDPVHVPEQGVFHLINTGKEIGAGLLLTSRAPARAWMVSLPDLRSRLRMAAPALLESPDETLLRQVLVKLFADRQLIVDKPVLDFLLARMERSFSAAVFLVDLLDREALAAGRRISRSLAGQVLATLGAPTNAFADRQ
jgi:chromosomal replication initiation ATPase DnaA